MQTENETQIEQVSPIESALTQANITAQVLAKLKEDYAGLKINGIDDIDGFKKVEEGKKASKKLRLLAVEICKTGREDAVKTQKAWIAKEKEIVAEITTIEDGCDAEITRVITEREQILFEAAQRAKLPERQAKLATVNKTLLEADLIKMDDLQFSQIFQQFFEEHLAERERVMKEQEERLAKLEREQKEREEAIAKEEQRKKEAEEAEKLAAALKQAEEQKAARAKQEEEIMAAQMRKQADEEAKRKAEQEIENAKKEAAERVKKAEEEAAAKIKQIEEENRKKEEARLADEVAANNKRIIEEQKAIEAELAKSDKQKFDDYVVKLNELTARYGFESQHHKGLKNKVDLLVGKLVNFINDNNK